MFMTGNPELIAHLERLFAEHGRIPFSRYMAEALYHPEHGYYSSDSDRIGAGGDFYTSSDLDSALGDWPDVPSRWFHHDDQHRESGVGEAVPRGWEVA